MYTILLVEDNEMNSNMLSRRLQRRGYEILLAEDGQQGVDLAIAKQPNLILMDLSLPVLDGLEATQMLKSDSRTEHIPVIALTAHAMNSDQTRALEAGCDDFDTKPIDLERLIGKISLALG